MRHNTKASERYMTDSRTRRRIVCSGETLRTFGHDGEVHLLEDLGLVLVVLVGEQPADATAVRPGVVEGDVGQEDGGVLDVIALPAAEPVQAVLKPLALHGALIVVVVDLQSERITASPGV